MDALFATFTGQTASTATGTRPAAAEEASVFDGLLAAAGIAPVAPVPPVVARQLEGRSASAPQSLIANTAAPANGETTAAQPGQSAQIAATAAETPVIPAQGKAAPQSSTSQTANAAVQAVPGASDQPLPAQSGAAASTSGGSASETGGSVRTAQNPSASIAAPTTGTTPEAIKVGDDTGAAAKAATPPVTTGKTATAHNNSVAQPVQPADTQGALAGANNSQTVSGGAGDNPVTAARTSTNAQASGAPSQAAGLVQPQAGVQARREADGQIAGQPGKTATKPAGSTNTAQPSPAVSTNPSAPQAPAAGTPPAAAAPDMSAALPRSGGNEPLAQAPQGDRATPPPVTIESGSSAPESEAETADMAQMRSADASRSAERPGTAAGTARFTPANAGTLAAQIASRYQNGERRFEIRMDPPELGRVEVKMHVGNDNRVHAVLSADRPETLQDMRQHIRELERALAEAGLDLSEDGLSFELSQDRDDTHEQSASSGGFSELAFAESASGDVLAAALPQELYGFRLARTGGVDVRL